MRKTVLVAGVATTQLLLVGLAVAPQLSARATGETYLVEVEPVDPIDPFRGAYVALAHPSLADPRWGSKGLPDELTGDVHVSLAERDGVWVGTAWSNERPDEGPYLTCHRIGSWSSLDCGIESFFVPQDRATELEALMGEAAEAEQRHQEWEWEVERLETEAAEKGQPVGTLPPEPEPAAVTVVAEVKIDSRGNAALVDVRER